MQSDYASTSPVTRTARLILTDCLVAGPAAVKPDAESAMALAERPVFAQALL
jgi:hypothetical protein